MIFTTYRTDECWIGGVNHLKTWAIVREQIDTDDEIGDTEHTTVCTVIGDRAEADRLVDELNRGGRLFGLAQRIIAADGDFGPSLDEDARKALGWDEP